MNLQTTRTFDPDRDQQLISQLAQIHYDCIEQDHAMLGFMPPLHMQDIIRYWEGCVDDVRHGVRDIIVQTYQNNSRSNEEVVGVVGLWKPVSGTGPFRAEVHRLLVSPAHRYKGVARMLMLKLEEVAKQKDRWLLLLDTTIGSGAEYLYPKLGYIQIGVVPNYGFSPGDGKLRDEMFFFKDLREPGTVTEHPVSISHSESSGGSK